MNDSITDILRRIQASRFLRSLMGMYLILLPWLLTSCAAQRMQVYTHPEDAEITVDGLPGGTGHVSLVGYGWPEFGTHRYVLEIKRPGRNPLVTTIENEPDYLSGALLGGACVGLGVALLATLGVKNDKATAGILAVFLGAPVFIIFPPRTFKDRYDFSLSPEGLSLAF